jgi:hypothetical protein
MKSNVRATVDYKPVGVTDVALGTIDLGKQPAHIEGRELRFCRLAIEPGGIVPWHSHDDRPALIFVEPGADCTCLPVCGRQLFHADLLRLVRGPCDWPQTFLIVSTRATFTSYLIGHKVGAIALTGGVVCYRIYSAGGLNAIDVFKICFLAGLAF